MQNESVKTRARESVNRRSESVNELREKTVIPRSQLTLSLFPGIDLLGRAFEAVGFCVVRGPDLITGGDVRDFAGVVGRFDGIFGGPPCQGFSSDNRHRGNPNHKSVVNSLAMIAQFERIVEECQPTWFCMENVPAVPDVRIEGYEVQRVPISDRECGGVQVRMRHFQFGHKDGWIIRPKRVIESVNRRKKTGPIKSAITTKPSSKWSTFADQCRKQGFEPSEISLPGWSKEAKFRAVGNGVPKGVGLAIARAVSEMGPRRSNDCPCGCGRLLTGRQKSATVTCRKRLQLRSEAQSQMEK